MFFLELVLLNFNTESHGGFAQRFTEWGIGFTLETPPTPTLPLMLL